DFVMRTKYILSEIDNVVAGRPVRHPEQIPAYRNSHGAPDPEKAREHMKDVVTRTATVEMMLQDGSPMLPMMGLAPVDYGGEVKAKAKAVTDA
ncbi:hypothetical protein B0T14DRAFT_406657, partial [Immersiella caudata]